MAFLDDQREKLTPLQHEEVHFPWRSYPDGAVPPCGEKHEDVGTENTVEGPTDEFMRKIRFNKERDWMNPIALMVRVFLFLLDHTILGSIVRNTNKFATQRWVKSMRTWPDRDV